MPSYFPPTHREPQLKAGESGQKIIFITASEHNCFFITEYGLFGIFPTTNLTKIGFIRSLWDFLNVYLTEKNENRAFFVMKFASNKFYGRLRSGVEYLWEDNVKDEEVFNAILVSYPKRLTLYWYEKIWQSLKEKYLDFK